MNKRVVIGMSGGVDSSVAAYLLKEQGYDVIGVTVNLWNDKVSHLSDIEDAKAICNLLDIPFYLFDFTESFEEKIIDYFVDEYFNGRTPNPCVMCNKKIKFNALLNKALELDAYYIATGHYAKVSYSSEYERYIIKKSITEEKDQTYALYPLTQNQLKHILMPLGNYTKDQTRKIASKLGFKIDKKPDSQEICFIRDNDYRKFLTEKRGKDIKVGDFVDKDGNILGKHKGIAYYTIGQRKGLGISCSKPMFVTEIKSEENIVVLGDNIDIFNNELIASNVNLLPFDKLERPINVTAKIRYNGDESNAKLIPLEKNKVKIIFDKPQRAITPGQSVVFYDKDLLLGGATIDK